MTLANVGVRTILVVDDDPMMPVLVEATLGHDGGYRLLTARNGLDGLEIARRERPALVLMDIRMPELGGIELCQLLKLDPATRQMKIIMLTGLAQETERKLAVEAGADEFLTKPFSPMALLKKVEHILKG